MRVKEVRISDTDRLVICHNPEAAERDRHIHAQLTELIADMDKLSAFKRGELRGRIAAKPGLDRRLRATPAGKLRIDQAKIKATAWRNALQAVAPMSAQVRPDSTLQAAELSGMRAPWGLVTTL